MERGVGKRFAVGKKAPPELQVTDDTPTGYVARTMFSKPAVVAKPFTKAEAKPVEKPKSAEKPKPKPKPKAEELAGVIEKFELGLTGDLKEMGELILEGQDNLYTTEVPVAYVPQTRRGFSEFIKSTYEPFKLPDGPITIAEGDKYYPYQEFVREYMRKESPYRGILVYHGLGSGKTCTAIAASEALFASAKKNIIVMTPLSLRKNFLREVSFCGFRHFQLNNFWVALDVKDATTTLFANQIYNLSGAYLKSVRQIWVPDFRKPQTESNYRDLTDDERSEIRKQILAMLEWDPVKNPNGRIKFINYNGLSAKKLMAMACDSAERKFFDNAVIVVDEIHNLIRLMQGKIEPYLSKVGPGGKKIRRTVPPEEITSARWKPALCLEGTKMYTRGYLFYRLLLDARNSKIIGLSGTPLINFPEELGILANVLHGYITTVQGVIQESGKEVQAKAEKVGQAHPYVDYIGVKQDSKGGGTTVLISLLPPGMRKLEDIGVTRIPDEEKPLSTDEIVESIRKVFEEAELPLTNIKTTAEALLPPFGDKFSEYFVNGNIIKNKAVLTTRLTGLVSFYKGSRLELMPRVKIDEIVRVPFSLYAQKAYSFKRSAEVKNEMGAEGQTIDKMWSLVYELGDSAGANNYKMGSRQACNFAFPPEVTRPAPTPTDRVKEAEDGAAAVLTDTPPEEKAEDEFVELGEEELVVTANEDEVIERELYEEGSMALPQPKVEPVPKPTPSGPSVKLESLEPLVDIAKEVARPVNTTRKNTSSPVIRFHHSMENPYKKFSNYAATPITLDVGGEEDTFPTVEHYYQAIKFKNTDKAWYEKIRDAPTPSKARELAAEKGHPKEKDFMEKRQDYMKRALDAKFNDKELMTLLKSTGDKKIIDASPKNSYWGEGADKGGENHLGKLLMELRGQEGGGKTIGELRAEKAADCKAGTAAGETYPAACAKAKECLKTIAKARMTLGPEGLANYSAKYTAMLERIAAAPGSSLVYSQFLDMEGIGIFRVAMEVNGYAPLDITITGGVPAFTKATEASLKKKQPRFMTFSGQEDADVRRTALDIFNAKFTDLPESMNAILKDAGYTDNKKGELCRVFCITSAGAEGLSLRNVRAVHIMEPYWNEVRLKQVKGRAIRIGSHLDLPEDQRDVSIYTYVSCFSEQAQRDRTGDNKIDETLLLSDSADVKTATEFGIPMKPGMTNYVLTTDEMIYAISEKKRKIIEALECIMKTAAVDCELSYKQNKDGTFRCLPLKGKVGDFIYNPNLEQDILEASKFEDEGIICSTEVRARELLKSINKIVYSLREVLGADKAVTGYEVFETIEVIDPQNPSKKIHKKKMPENRLGTVGVRLVNGAPEPGPPVSIRREEK